MTLNMKEKLNEAEKNARLRDIEVEKNNYIDLEKVNEIEKKANDLGYGLYKKRNINQAKFIQTIHENLEVLIKKQYLTNAELSFMLSIFPLIDYQTNAILSKDGKEFLNVSQIAKYLNKTRNPVSKTINSLIEKGILFEFVDIEEIKKYKRNISARILFVNPELFYAGDRNKIDSTLTLLVTQNDKLEKNGMLLNWKVWRKKGETFGRLYRRKTYLSLKNQ